MSVYLIGFRQKGNRYGKVQTWRIVNADNASQALGQTFLEKNQRNETWLLILKQVDENTEGARFLPGIADGAFQYVIDLDTYRANVNREPKIDLEVL